MRRPQVLLRLARCRSDAPFATLRNRTFSEPRPTAVT